MTKKLTFTCAEPGSYWTWAKAIDSGLPPMTVTIERNRWSGGWWIVTTDTEQRFASLGQAKAYVRRFFEAA